MWTKGHASLLMAILLLPGLATLTAAAESEGAPEVVTARGPVALTGLTEATYTDVVTLLRPGSAADSIVLDATAPTVHVTRFTVRQSCLSTMAFCQVNPNGGVVYEKEEFTLENARLVLEAAHNEFLGVLTTDKSFQRASDATPGVASVGLATNATLTANERKLAYDPAPFQGANRWSSFPTYRFGDTEFNLQNLHGGNLTHGGWFELALFDATFRLAEDTEFATYRQGYTTGKVTGPATTTSREPTVGDIIDQYLFLEFGSGATLTVTTDGPVETVSPALVLRQTGGGLQYVPNSPDPKAAAPVARSGDHHLVPQRVTRPDGLTPLLQFVLTPQAAAVPPASVDGERALDDPVVAGAALAVGVAGVAGLAALAYWWPTVRFGATALMLPMYTRIGKGEVLEHDTRDFIYTLIKGSPGIHAHEISERANIGWGTTVYHLKLLESHRMVVGKRTGRYKRFFVNDGRLSSKKEAYGILRNETSNRVAQYVLQHPGCNQKDLCAVLDLKPSLVNWHMTKLEEADLVKKIKDGRTVRYFAGPAWAEMQLPGFGGGAVATPAPAANAGPGASAVSKSMAAGFAAPVTAVGEDES
ncbi:MAG TPA: winged helix-turn-helix transcriptional regulator [Candidatus Thermoplasmatota archaeon]|nr:winged helix-turn-helix transcriptional regulator [Candidatus Thermoplasmatota archaeon]